MNETTHTAAAESFPNWSREPVATKRGIPRFVPRGEYSENFGSQWLRFPRTQLDSHTGLPLTRDRLARVLGKEIWETLAGKQVLEAGCGAGRFTEILLQNGAYVTSVDLSSAVEANAQNFPAGERHRIAQADILDLPFQPGHFDVVVCLGVLQHTPDPEISLRELYRQLKPGGWLAIDHYTHEVGRWTSLKWLYRAWLKRQPEQRRWTTVERLADLFLPLHRALRSIYPLWFLLCRFSPLTTFYRSIPELPEPLQREFAILDTHDSLTDWYKHLRTHEQIERAIRELGADSIQCWAAGNGIEARCGKPVTQQSRIVRD